MLFLYLRKSKVKLLQVFKIALKIIEDLNYFDYNGKQIYNLAPNKFGVIF